LNVSLVFDWERSLRAAPLRIQYPSLVASKKNAPAQLSQDAFSIQGDAEYSGA
jgi:hypothetical protein